MSIPDTENATNDTDKMTGESAPVLTETATVGLGAATTGPGSQSTSGGDQIGPAWAPGPLPTRRHPSAAAVDTPSGNVGGAPRHVHRALVHLRALMRQGSLTKAALAAAGLLLIAGLVGSLAAERTSANSRTATDDAAATGRQMTAVGAAVAGSPAIDPQALKVLDGVRSEVIPEEGTKTAYGVSFTSDGYNTLLEWNQQYKVSKAIAASFEAMNMTLPCCGWSGPSSDESKNCGCGHHQALYGVAKRLFMDGARIDEAQAQVTKWSAYFFPRETLQAELEKRALDDPAMKGALDALKQKGGC